MCRFFHLAPADSPHPHVRAVVTKPHNLTSGCGCFKVRRWSPVTSPPGHDISIPYFSVSASTLTWPQTDSKYSILPTWVKLLYLNMLECERSCSDLILKHMMFASTPRPSPTQNPPVIKHSASAPSECFFTLVMYFLCNLSLKIPKLHESGTD